MRARVVTALCVVVLAVVVLGCAGCGSSSAPPPSVAIAPVDAQPSGAQEVTTPPTTANVDCGDREASLRPGPLPAPGAMPPGSTMAAIADRGRLIVGVDQNTNLFGYRNPATGQLEGFDIDVAREIARSHLRRSEPHRSARRRSGPTGIGVAEG